MRVWLDPLKPGRAGADRHEDVIDAMQEQDV